MRKTASFVAEPESEKALSARKTVCPTYERYVLDLLERSKLAIKQSKERLAESQKLKASCRELVERMRRVLRG